MFNDSSVLELSPLHFSGKRGLVLYESLSLPRGFTSMPDLVEVTDDIA